MAIETKPRSVTQDIWKIDISRNPQSPQIKALKPLVRVTNQIVNMTIDTEPSFILELDHGQTTIRWIIRNKNFSSREADSFSTVCGL